MDFRFKEKAELKISIVLKWINYHEPVGFKRLKYRLWKLCITLALFIRKFRHRRVGCAHRLVSMFILPFVL